MGNSTHPTPIHQAMVTLVQGLSEDDWQNTLTDLAIEENEVYAQIEAYSKQRFHILVDNVTGLEEVDIKLNHLARKYHTIQERRVKLTAARNGK